MVKQNMGWFVLMAALIILEVIPYCYYIAERGSGSRNWLEWIYLSVMTATTVGYGDITPKTNLGRVISILTACMGLIITAFVVALVMKVLTLSQMQEEAGVWVWERKQTKKHQQLAAEFIQFVWRHHVWKENVYGQHPRRDKVIETRFHKKCLHYTTNLNKLRREKLWKKLSSMDYTRSKLKKLEQRIVDLKQQTELGSQLNLRTNETLDILCHVLADRFGTPIESLPYPGSARR